MLIFDLLRNTPLMKTAPLRIFRTSSRLTPFTSSQREASLTLKTVPVSTLLALYAPAWSAIVEISGFKPTRSMSGIRGSAPSSGSKPSKVPSTPRPSSSVLLISPTNEVLLLHRVQTSTSFPSAHVFPGGNLSSEQDGQIPEVDDPLRHEDGPAYRLGAIRECFEESGILLARRKESAAHALLEVAADVREEGRKAVHCNRIRFSEWLEQLGGVADTENLIPFTRWITPSNITRRFTTQMYIYFLPLATAHNAHSPSLSSFSDAQDAVIPSPTPDGGLEHTAARFLPPSKWLSMARLGEIVLFPPQYFLLHLISQILFSEKAPRNIEREELKRQRDALMEFLETGDPPWGDKCISPFSLLGKREDGRTALSLERPGLGLESVGRRGDSERVVLVRFSEEGPRDLEVAWKIDVLEQDERMKGKL